MLLNSTESYEEFKAFINIPDPVFVDGDRLASLAAASRSELINGQVRWHEALRSWDTN